MSTRRSKLVLVGTLACLVLGIVALMRSDADSQPAGKLQLSAVPSTNSPLPASRGDAASERGVATRPATDPDDIQFNLSDRLADLKIENGALRAKTDDGETTIDAEAFLRAVEARQREARSRHRLLQFFDTTSFLGLIWVAIGFAGQFVFMGRMLVQWWASEKQRRSVVPVAFWWMSLAGGSMVLAYFVWRRDPVGIFGQAMGWIIYARNLWLIYRPHEQAAPPATASPEGPIANP